jgi:hypothetical protein
MKYVALDVFSNSSLTIFQMREQLENEVYGTIPRCA